MKVIADTEDQGLRIDVWLAGKLPDISRSRTQALIKAGNVLAGGKPVKANLRVAAGFEVEVEIPPAVDTALLPECIPLDILFEDKDIVVINKPAGLVVHPAAGHATGTLVHALLYHCSGLSGIGGEKRPGIVHRLDKDTSGAMVVAKNEVAMAKLVDQFKAGNIFKEYAAVVWGKPSPVEGKIETLIGRSSHDRKKMSARTTNGRRAVSHYKVEETRGDFSFMKVRIETGRTHQIRVHMAHIGHPVAGDAQYGRSNRRSQHPPFLFTRQMLHAQTLRLVHPASGEVMTFQAPLPADMAQFLKAWRKSG